MKLPVFPRWGLILATLVLGPIPALSQANIPLGFVPLQPCRVVDTRSPMGPLGGPFIAANSARSFSLAGACGVPAGAAAYSVNVTVVPHRKLGYLTVWPTGSVQPYVSTLNSFDGRVKANAAIVPAGTSGAISVFVTDDTDVVIDIDGYFAAASNPAALLFYPVTPCRILDTRNAAGSLGGPSLSTGESRTIPIQSSSCQIPSNAGVYSLNFTVVPSATLGYLSTWPTGSPQPYVSTLNDTVGTVVANAAIVPAGANGSIDIAVTNQTDVIVDINGYFAPPSATGLSFYAIPPCRVSDSRSPTGTFGGPELGAQDTRGIPVPMSACSVPSTAQAYSLNVTALPRTALGFLSLWPTDQSQPYVSTLNSYDGSAVSNAAIVPASSNGSMNVYVSNPANVVLDINGYFAPASTSVMPLSALDVHDSNIDTSQPFTIQFSNSAGFSFTESATRVDANGTIVAAVPIYTDPGTTQMDTGTVQLTLQQASYTSPAQTLTIQTLPDAATYGLQPGEATHAMLVFDALLLSRRINQLQTLQLLPGNTVDTTQAQGVLQNLLTAVIEARHDVDKVIQNNSVVVQDETLPNGITIQFDSTALDMMDRVNCNFLMNTLATLPSPPSGASSHAERKRTSGSTPSALKDIIDLIQTYNGARTYQEGSAQYQNSQDWIDNVESAAKMAGGYADVLLGSGVADDTAESKSFGLVASVMQNVRVIGDAFAQDAAYITGVVTNDQALQQVALEAMQETEGEHWSAAIDLGLTLVGGPTATSELESLGSVSTVGSFIKSMYDDLSKNTEQQADQTAIDIANEFPSLPATDSQDFGYVDGNVQISNSDGIASAQTGIDAQSNGFEFQTLADPNGNYDLMIPLQDESLDYTNVTIEAYDPITGQSLTSETVDLAGVTDSAPGMAPAMSSTCVDTDDDEDDPDCDSTAQVQRHGGAKVHHLPGHAQAMHTPQSVTTSVPQ